MRPAKVYLAAALVMGGANAAEAPFRDCPDCPEMIRVPAGSFVMGSPATEAGRLPNEGPQHAVEISRPFAIGVYSVTRAEYAAFVAATKRGDGDGCYVWDGDKKWAKDTTKSWRDPGFKQTERDPVVCVSWNDAVAYVDWLNAKTKTKIKSGYRLPSESEWEYAARAGTTTASYWGDQPKREQANYGTDGGAFAGPQSKDKDRWDFTSPAGSFPANAFGLFDMEGNAAQLMADCRDRWDEDYDGAPADGSAAHKGQCTVRAIRGSSWDSSPPFVRISNRGATMPDFRLDHLGFRVARNLD